MIYPHFVTKTTIHWAPPRALMGFTMRVQHGMGRVARAWRAGRAYERVYSKRGGRYLSGLGERPAFSVSWEGP